MKGRDSKDMNAPLKFSDFKSKREGRIAIAKDALKWIAASKKKDAKFSPKLTPGTYLTIRSGVDLRANAGKDARKEFGKSVQKCDVCALGGLFVSSVRLFNRVSLGDIGSLEDERYDFRELMVKTGRLEKFFSRTSLENIEDAFESSQNEPWFEAIPHPTERFAAICKNIVRNGDFKPEDLPIVRKKAA